MGQRLKLILLALVVLYIVGCLAAGDDKKSKEGTSKSSGKGSESNPPKGDKSGDKSDGKGQSSKSADNKSDDKADKKSKSAEKVSEKKAEKSDKGADKPDGKGKSKSAEKGAEKKAEKGDKGADKPDGKGKSKSAEKGPEKNAAKGGKSEDKTKGKSSKDAANSVDETIAQDVQLYETGGEMLSPPQLSPPNFSSLPAELLLNVFRNLEMSDTPNASLVNRKFLEHSREAYPAITAGAIRSWQCNLYNPKLSPQESLKAREKITKGVTPVTEYLAPEKFGSFWKVVSAYDSTSELLANITSVNSSSANITSSASTAGGTSTDTISTTSERLTSAIKFFFDNPNVTQAVAEKMARQISGVDHYHILRFLVSSLDHKNTGFDLSYAYSRFITKVLVKEWKKEFSPMMHKWALIVLNAGNAHKTLEKMSTYKLEDILKFQYDKEKPFLLNPKLLKYPISSTAMAKLHLETATKAVSSLHKLLLTDYNIKDALNMFAMVYCAMQNLIGPNFEKDAIQTKISLLRFDLMKDELVEKMRKSLADTLKRNGAKKILNTGLDELKKSFTKTFDRNQSLSDREVETLMEMDDDDDGATNKCMFEFLGFIDESIQSLPTQRDLKKFNKLLETVLSCDRLPASLRMTVFSEYFTHAVTPAIFNNDNTTELELVDSKLHLLLRDEWLPSVIGSDAERIERWNELFQHFNSFLSVYENSRPEFSIRQGTILKHGLAMFTKTGAWDSWVSWDRVERIMKSFYFLASKQWQLLSDLILLRMWILATHYLPPNFKKVLFDKREPEFNIIHRPLDESELNPIVYLIHCRLLVLWRAFNLTSMTQLDSTSQIFTNILRIEEEIGDATDCDSFLQEMVSQQKFTFNTKFADEIRDRQQHDLNKFIKSKSELLTNHWAHPVVWNCANDEAIILKSIFIAITENESVTVDPDLVPRLDELMLTINPTDKTQLFELYKKCKDRLKLSLVDVFLKPNNTVEKAKDRRQ